MAVGAIWLFSLFDRSLPVFDCDLMRARQGQFPCWSIFCKRRPGTDGGARTDFDWRNQLRVRTNEGVVADDRAELVYAVVVARDGTGADIDALAHVGVSDVRQMVHLGIPTDHGLLDLYEVANVVVALQFCTRTQPRIWADAGVAADVRIFEMAEGQNLHIFLNLHVTHDAVGAHADTVAQLDAAFKDAAHVDLDVAPADQLASDIDAVGIDQRDACFQKAIGLHALPGALKRCELNLKTVESTLSQIRRRRARGTSGLWPSSP